MVLLQQYMYFSHLFHNNSSQKAKPTWFKYPFHPLRVAGCPKETDGTTEERVETARPMQPGGWVWYIWILDTGYNRSTYVIFNRSQIHYAFFFEKSVYQLTNRGTEKEHVLSKAFAPCKTDVYDSAFLIYTIPASSASFESFPIRQFLHEKQPPPPQRLSLREAEVGWLYVG